MSTKRFEEADQLQLRVEHVCDLASLLGSGGLEDKRFPEPLEWIEDHMTEKYFHGRAVELFRLLSAFEEPEAWEFGEALIDSGHRGFLVQVSTPVMKRLKGGIDVFSWSRKYIMWVYGDTFEEAWEDAKRWATERQEEDAQKGGAA